MIDAREEEEKEKKTTLITNSGRRNLRRERLIMTRRFHIARLHFCFCWSEQQQPSKPITFIVNVCALALARDTANGGVPFFHFHSSADAQQQQQQQCRVWQRDDGVDDDGAKIEIVIFHSARHYRRRRRQCANTMRTRDDKNRRGAFCTEHRCHWVWDSKFRLAAEHMHLRGKNGKSAKKPTKSPNEERNVISSSATAAATGATLIRPHTLIECFCENLFRGRRPLAQIDETFAEKGKTKSVAGETIMLCRMPEVVPRPARFLHSKDFC